MVDGVRVDCVGCRGAKEEVVGWRGAKDGVDEAKDDWLGARGANVWFCGMGGEAAAKAAESNVEAGTGLAFKRDELAVALPMTGCERGAGLFGMPNDPPVSSAEMVIDGKD